MQPPVEPEEDPPGAVRPPRDRGFLTGLLAVFVVALGLRLAYLAELADSPFRDERELIDDASFYDQRARQVLDGNLLGNTVGFLSPVYCFSTGAVYALFGADPWNMKRVQAVLGALTCALLAQVGRRLFGPRIGLGAGLLLALYPLHVYYTGILLPTVVVTLANIGFLALLLPTERGLRIGRTFLAGVALGLAIGAKPNALLLVPVALLWIQREMRAAGMRAATLQGLALLLGTGLIVVPLSWRNYALSGEFVLVSAVGGRNLLKGNGPLANGTHVFLGSTSDAISLHGVSEGEADPNETIADDLRLRREALDWALGHPGRTLGLWLKKAYLFLNAHELGVRDQYDFARERFAVLRFDPFGFGLIVPIGLVGLLYTLRQPRTWLLTAILAVQLASFMLVFVLARYRLVAVACLALLAVAELARWAALVRERGPGSLRVPLALGLAATVLVNAPSGFERERGYADQYAFIARQQMASGDNEAAIESWRKALDSSWQNDSGTQQDDLVWCSIADCYYNLGRMEEAREALREALAVEIPLDSRRSQRRRQAAQMRLQVLEGQR